MLSLLSGGFQPIGSERTIRPRRWQRFETCQRTVRDVRRIWVLWRV